MTAASPPGQTAVDYHERTKHHWHRFARSAGYMDWDNQPAPFRTFDGTSTIPLPLGASDPDLDYAALYHPAATPPAPFSRFSLGRLLELSLGLSAWKAVSGQRWALRINPSSGNLHPTEAYLLTLGVQDLPDGICHYHPLDHALEERARLTAEQSRALARHLASPGIWVVLSSIFRREAWKYGERAYRYCQHDIGHALAALSLAARLLGWRLLRLAAADTDIAAAFGFDRTPWQPKESEEPALLAAFVPVDTPHPPAVFPGEAIDLLSAIAVKGRPTPLSARHQDWPVISRVSAACRQPHAVAPPPPPADGPQDSQSEPAAQPAAVIIRQRRSAQAFDPEGELDQASFFGILDRTLPRAACPPFDAAIGPPRISLALFVHRIRGLSSGLYAFIRHPDHQESLRRSSSPAFAWEPATPDLPLYRLASGDFRAEALDLSCRQEIAGWSTFSLGMLARFAPEVTNAPWVYRHLFWEAGLIGQVLYLEAEARGVRGTGIGCYFDDPVHDLLGQQDRTWQSLYHFTIGVPVEDPRLQTLPPYFHLGPERRTTEEPK